MASRGALVLLTGLLAMCSDDTSPVDTGRDAPMDTPRDPGSRDSRQDTRTDAPRDTPGDRADRDAGPPEWTPIEGLPDGCDVDFAVHPENVLNSIVWQPCPSGEPGDCEVLSYELGRRTTREVVVRTLHSIGAANNPLLAISQTESGSRISAEIVDPSGPRVLTAWRYTLAVDRCRLRNAATDDQNLGFELALPEKESLFYRTPLSGLPSIPTTPIGRLTVDEQPGSVGSQRMVISSSTLGIVLQPGGVLWLFQDGDQRRRGGPLEPDVPGAVSNSFSVVGSRLYWGIPSGVVTAAQYDAPAQLLHDAGTLSVSSVQADDEFVAWVQWDGADSIELWSAPVVTAPEDFSPQRVATLPVFNGITMGEGLVAFTEGDPTRILLFDLRGGPTRQWQVPLNWSGSNEMLWVNRRELAFVTLEGRSIFFTTVMRVPTASFEPL